MLNRTLQHRIGKPDEFNDVLHHSAPRFPVLLCTCTMIVLGALPFPGPVIFSPWAYGHVSVHKLAQEVKARQAAALASVNKSNSTGHLTQSQLTLLDAYLDPRYERVSHNGRASTCGHSLPVSLKHKFMPGCPSHLCRTHERGLGRSTPRIAVTDANSNS